MCNCTNHSPRLLRDRLLPFIKRMSYWEVALSYNKQTFSTEKISKSKAILANSTIRVMLPGKETIEITDLSNPLSDVVAYINRGINADDFGKPIKFNAVLLKNRGMFVNKFEIK